jgi:hypothetical protein
MTWFLWILLCALLLAMVLPGIFDGKQRVQFPFLAALAASYHVLLPLYGLIVHQEATAAPGLERVVLMSILCIGAAWAGYQGSWRSTLIQSWRIDEGRLAMGAALLAAVGLFAYLELDHIDIDRTREGQMTGFSTVLFFFSTAARFGFVIAAVLYIRNRSAWLLLLLLPQLWIYGSQLMEARRTPMGELAVSALLLLYFAKRWTPPAWLILIGLLLSAVYNFNITVLRTTLGQPLNERFRVLMEASPLDALNTKRLAESESFSVEFFNAANFMAIKARTGYYTYGRHFWNQLVFGWVPAQYLGREFKESLYFELKDDAAEAGFEKWFGTCETGIAEAFMAFGYFGAFLFFMMGAALRFLWDSSQNDSLVHQTLLVLCTFGSCMTFSGQLWSHVNYVSQILVFTAPIFYFARIDGSGTFVRKKTAEPIEPAVRPRRELKRIRVGDHS